eukprot:TRINITY_DN15575_c0_g2_i1.p1 TRINITY_DN15575_c0_g2~~TRINITY_DN15575_c0_g2_i1.p1  ORF type:complete len:634 (+),score=211.74 TRINITY_DN15575_c0_g2_i1:108-2009(+)
MTVVLQRMKITEDVNEAFDDQCVVDGDFKYIPRDQLMNALHMMGCNPTYQALEDLIPEVGEDVRVDFDQFKMCHEAVKHTKGFNKQQLLEAFYTFDKAQSGRLTVDEFLMAMGCGDNDMRGQEQEELLRTADPMGTGEVDYVAFANRLCPDPPKQKREKRVKRDGKEEIVLGDEEVVEDAPVEEDNRDYDGEARQDAWDDMLSSLLKEGQLAEQERKHIDQKLEAWLKALRDLELRPVQTDDVRVDREQSESEAAERSKAFADYKKTTQNAQAELARYEQEYQNLMRSVEAQRRAADENFRALPRRYTTPVFDSIRTQLSILFQCRHRIASNTWRPLTDSDRARADFLAGCGGHPDDPRGSAPAVEPAGSEEEIVAFKIGSYIHHGTSSYWDGGKICLLPPDVLESHANTPAARLLTVPCELEKLGCGLDIDTDEAKACRAAFFDGVNGRDLGSDLPSGMEKKLELCHQRGLWYHAEVKGEGSSKLDEMYAGVPHHMLGSKMDVRTELDSLKVKVDAAAELVRAVEEEERLFAALIKEAFDKAAETQKESADFCSSEQRKFDQKLREIKEAEEAERRRREEEEERKRREEEERKRKEAEAAKKKEEEEKKPPPAPKPQEKPKEVPKKGGGGCC